VREEKRERVARSVLSPMTSAAKCDKECELRNVVSHRVLECI